MLLLLRKRDYYLGACLPADRLPQGSGFTLYLLQKKQKDAPEASRQSLTLEASVFKGTEVITSVP